MSSQGVRQAGQVSQAGNATKFAVLTDAASQNSAKLVEACKSAFDFPTHRHISTVYRIQLVLRHIRL
jgi:hypothetical protein